MTEPFLKDQVHFDSWLEDPTTPTEVSVKGKIESKKPRRGHGAAAVRAQAHIGRAAAADPEVAMQLEEEVARVLAAAGAAGSAGSEAGGSKAPATGGLQLSHRAEPAPAGTGP